MKEHRRGHWLLRLEGGIYGCLVGDMQWRSLRFPTEGSKTYIPRNFYKTGGRKRICPKISIRKLHTLH
ncbi:hypothetical protein Hanom_Chr14g01286351 [Helianthus anomalus]